MPSDLKAGHLPEGISLSWQTNRRPSDVISGYNVYISPELSIVDLSPYAPEVIKCLWLSRTYPGDTDTRIDFERAEITDAEYGVEYHIHVRTVMADGAFGPPSEEITVIPRLSGRINLLPRFAGKREGFCFAEQQYVATQDARNDLYLYVKNDSVFAASPHRLDRYNRHTEFFEVGPSAAIDDYPRRQPAGKGETTIHLRMGMTYILSTAETCLAKFRVAEIRGSGDQTVVTADYVYQPRCGVGVF